MDKKYVCPCGLMCCDCMFYKREIFETARRLKELIYTNELDKFLNICSRKSNWEAIGEHLDISEYQIWDSIGKHFDIFKQMPEFMNVLDSIIKLQCDTTCQENGGCSIGGTKHICIILECIRSKEYEGCWECKLFEKCDKLLFLKNNYGYVIEDNLKTIKENGIAEVKSRGNQYYAWQRKKGDHTNV